MSSTVKFGMKTDRTLVEFGGNRDLRNAMSIPMKVGNTARVEVTKALMPEDAELIAGKVANKIRCHVGVGDGRRRRGWPCVHRR